MDDPGGLCRRDVHPCRGRACPAPYFPANARHWENRLLGPLWEGAPAAAGGGENFAAIRNISGYGKVLSLRPCGATSLAEGGRGPLLILAGAGSGKTTVLVNRIANIIRFGSAHGSTELPRPVTEADLNDLRNAVAAGRDLPRETAYLAVRPARPWNVLAITFTNKAAGELKERLRAMLGDTLGGDVNASTFHSACVRMLRRDAERIGFPKSFTIYDSDDQQRVIKQIYKDLMIDDKFLPVKSAIGQISSFKDKLLSAEDVAGEPFANTKAQLGS